MKRRIAKVFTILLMMVSVLFILPMQAKAYPFFDIETGQPTLPGESDGKVIASGVDEGVEWKVINTQTLYGCYLVVKVDGEIPNYLRSNSGCPGKYAPWKNYQYDILILQGNMTCIGNNAFEACYSIEWPVYIPNTVTELGDGVFSAYGQLKNIYVPDSVVTFGSSPFPRAATIHCSSTSKAAEYAKKEGLKVEYTDEQKPSEDPDDNDGEQQAKFYKITYILNGGTNSPSNPSKIKEGEHITLLGATKKGSLFLGWYDNRGVRVTEVSGADYTLIAKWEKISLSAPKKLTLKKLSKTKIRVTVASVKKAEGYEIQYSVKSNLKNAITKVVNKKTCKETISKLSRRRYYVRVRAYKKDSTGKKVYSKWSNKQSIKL